MYNPVSTLRLQFNKTFTLKSLDRLIPFIVDLGVKTIYASPIFNSMAGSEHGYDVIDPLMINPEIGTEEELVALAKKLDDKGIGWIQDIVPNHMAFHPSNPWIFDLLKKGPESEFADFFDTAWTGDFFKDKPMLPFLADSLEKTISRSQLQVVSSSGYQFKYNQLMIPLNVESARYIGEKSLHDINIDRELLEHLANIQFYRLCSYTETNSKINYRRFFTINGLICLNITKSNVFNTYHQLIVRLVGNGTFKGLRVDHIDGIFDPVEYMRKLRELVGPEVYIVIEKILEGDEQPDASWPVQGTTGYDFLAMVNNVFSSEQGIRSLNEFYKSVSPGNSAPEELIAKSKRLILDRYMNGEIDNLVNYLTTPSLDENPPLIKEAIIELIVSSPYYRYYGSHPSGLLEECSNRRPDLADAFAKLEQALRVPKFYGRLMQFMAPAMAKGVEDTFMYVFNGFVGHNEVGDSPDYFTKSIRKFHDAMRNRLKRWSYSLNATATHDAKHGEDARARLNVLTDMSSRWHETVNEWFSLNQQCREQNQVHRNDEYFIYQTVVSTYPGEMTHEYSERLGKYLIKALREAKVNSNWDAPNENYEANVVAFTKEIFTNRDFISSFLSIAETVRRHGNINSLSQLTLKITCPGIPDIYQGSLTWDLSFVDPDNRRAVDYDSLSNGDNIKFHFTKLLLMLRAQYENVFTVGNYQPLTVTGKFNRQVIAFGREHQGTWIIVACVLHSIHLDGDWGNTSVLLPEHCPLVAEDLIDGASYHHSNRLNAVALFKNQTVALLLLKADAQKRTAGVLMPVASLPSAWNIGDVGASARAFVDFLFLSRQRAWQMLPLNDTDQSSCYSPYSALSSIAGNRLLISPEDLVADGLLTHHDIAPKRAVRKKKVIDYKSAEKEKDSLLDLAWENFETRKPCWLTQQFEKFINDEHDWLDFYETSKIKFIQFIFFRQVKALRRYCNERGIIMIGDVPFYMSANSADARKYPELFSVDKNGETILMAGTPPDYFNKEGQLWGMPVYNWDTAGPRVIAWWIQRFKKNLEYFDKLRIDHFRAFSAYWAVPAATKKAIDGKWMPGPGIEFFHAIQKHLGNLPFIAEDLGDIDKPVYDLRDIFNLPGMKVLQFAFGRDFPSSTHLPHNYGRNFYVYTGTHDNNTTRGWYHSDLDEMTRKNLRTYVHSKVTEKTAADTLIRLAYSSCGDTVIIPMQDILNLNEKSRLNIPSTRDKNWTWRLMEIPGDDVRERLRRLVYLYER